MLIRRETPADVPAVRDVTTAAFDRTDTPVPVEVTLLDELRECEEWLDPLSLVAVGAEGGVVGHVVCTRGRVDGRPALGLGPLSVHPRQQRQGVGSALVHAVLGAADALGATLVALLGDPAYYGRFGFRSAEEQGVAPPDPAWGTYFQVRKLGAYEPGLRGTFAYAEPFTRV